MGSLRSSSGKDHNSDKIWRRTIVAAIACRELGVRSKLHNPAPLFLAGLLQDIGILALCQIDPAHYPGILESNTHDELIQKEREKYGCDHSAVAVCLAEAWRLPASLIDAMRDSHSHTIVENPDENDKFKLCIALSGVVSDWVLEDQQSQINFIHDASAKLGLSDDDIGNMIDDILLMLPNMSQLFELELIDQASIEGILNKSKDLLRQREQHQNNPRKISEQPGFIERRARSLQEMARRDSLTGLYNSHYMNAALSETFMKSLKQGKALSIIILEIDNYAQLKAENGEQVAEFILKKLANIIESHEIKGAMTGRHQDNGFIMLLPNTNSNDTEKIAQRILTSISEKPLELAENLKFHTSCSAGTASQHSSEKFSSYQSLKKAAQSALARATRAGCCQLQSYN